MVYDGPGRCSRCDVCTCNYLLDAFFLPVCFFTFRLVKRTRFGIGSDYTTLLHDLRYFDDILGFAGELGLVVTRPRWGQEEESQNMLMTQGSIGRKMTLPISTPFPLLKLR